MEFRGVSLDHYDRINELIGSLPGGPAAHHELFHWVTPIDGGFRVVDVWESEDAFRQFLRDRLEPVFDEAEVSAPPEIEVFPVYNYSFGARWRA